MKKEIIYEIKALYRDDFRVTGYSFGEGENTICIVGSMRGNEFQQIYACSQLIKQLQELEKKGRILDGRKIMVIPCANPYSVNIKKRFWSVDNTDINRMFPGYYEGETTQRIAGGIFDVICQYKYGIQFASFYMPGHFVPHVRIMKTGNENEELAKKFGLPYVVLHHPRPFDTTTLNYNWQMWGTDGFSIYTSSTSDVNKVSAKQAVAAILNFMSKQNIIQYRGYEGYISRVIESTDMVNVRTPAAGFFEALVDVGEKVEAGQVLARVNDPYLGVIKAEITAPLDSTVAFVHTETMAYQNTAVFKLIPEEY